MKMITPVWKEKIDMGIWTLFDKRTTDENKLIRLAFHDCIPYEDGTGGCDGCLNWEGMDDPFPSVFSQTGHYTWKPVLKTNNQFLDRVVENLEKIYKNIDWPYTNPSLEVSLYQSGKSRADLWQFAALVALEEALERANRACDLDYHQRQQVTLLEGRKECEIKLTKPLKFMTGRKDCITQEDPTYKTYHEENHPKLFGDGKDLIDYGMSAFGMSPEHWSALQGIHGIVDFIDGPGTKYTWFGSGYISNTYFKQIANKPMYKGPSTGGDLSFTDCIGDFESAPLWKTFGNFSVGKPDGEPNSNNGWRVQCWHLWNTTEGGPCFMRPIKSNAWDAPNPGQEANEMCFNQRWDASPSDGPCQINTSRCPDAYCDENNILRGARAQGVTQTYEGPYQDASQQEQNQRKWFGVDNRFGFPWEIGMYWNLTVGGLNQRAMGCPGLDVPFGTIDRETELGSPNWPYKKGFASPAMNCGLNDYKPMGCPASMHEIIDELATDNEIFAEKFLEGWQLMTNNGYFQAPSTRFLSQSDTYLEDGPENGWLGYYSLSQQGRVMEPDFETFIEENKPVWFTDPSADPWICGHKGHFIASCGNRFSYFIEQMNQGRGSCALNNPWD